MQENDGVESAFLVDALTLEAREQELVTALNAATLVAILLASNPYVGLASDMSHKAKQLICNKKIQKFPVCLLIRQKHCKMSFNNIVSLLFWPSVSKQH